MSTPIWFGPAERRLFGWVHAPEGESALGGVVLCPPLGREAVTAYLTYRALATRMAAKGLAVVRFDYDGTGDSSGNGDEPDRIEAWLGSSTAAIDLLLSAGVASIGLLGMRMGALLAIEAAARSGGVAALVLWDPCTSGRQFLREQRALLQLTLSRQNAPTVGDGDLPSLRFDPTTVTDLARLRLGSVGMPVAERVMVLSRSDPSRSTQLVEQLATAGVDCGPASGQDELLDPDRQEIPWEAVQIIADWMGARFSGPDASLRWPTNLPTVAAVGVGDDVAMERPVSIGNRLFGFLTEPVKPRQAPALLFVNEHYTPHIGPSRLWVELARNASALGIRSLRFDASGNGESPVSSGAVPRGVLVPGILDDVLEAAEAASPEDRTDVVLVGLCSGAYVAMEAALVLRPRGVMLINPYSVYEVPSSRATSSGPLSAAQTTRPWLRVLRHPMLGLRGRIFRTVPASLATTKAVFRRNWLGELAGRHPKLPHWLWDLAAAVSIVGSPASVFERLVGAGVDVYVVCSPEDAAFITVGQSWRLKRLLGSTGFDLKILDRLDHSVLSVGARHELRTVLLDHLEALATPTIGG